MSRFTDFIAEHAGDDPSWLVLHKDKWPDVDVTLAACTIAGREKMRTKAPSWFAQRDVIYPTRLCVEQCSSEAACAIKTDIILGLGVAARQRGDDVADACGETDRAVRQPGDDVASACGGTDRAVRQPGYDVASACGGTDRAVRQPGDDVADARGGTDRAVRQPGDDVADARGGTDGTIETGGEAARRDGLRIADLTGGLGVDSYAFSEICDEVLYVESDGDLARVARDNFAVLGRRNITVINAEITPLGLVTGSPAENQATSSGLAAAKDPAENPATSLEFAAAGTPIEARCEGVLGESAKERRKASLTELAGERREGKLGDPAEARCEGSSWQAQSARSVANWKVLRDFAPDVIYIDPSRRSRTGKVFKIEDCTPNVLPLKDTLLSIASILMIKLSPMADIDMVLRELGGRCRRLDVISVGGECKEILVTMDRNHNGECLISADCSRADSFHFYRSEEACATARLATSTDLAALNGLLIHTTSTKTDPHTAQTPGDTPAKSDSSAQTLTGTSTKSDSSAKTLTGTSTKSDSSAQTLTGTSAKSDSSAQTLTGTSTESDSSAKIPGGTTTGNDLSVQMTDYTGQRCPDAVIASPGNAATPKSLASTCSTNNVSALLEDAAASRWMLLEPDKALMKAAPFKLLSSRFNLTKLDISTHYYICPSDSAAGAEMHGMAGNSSATSGADKSATNEAQVAAEGVAGAIATTMTEATAIAEADARLTMTRTTSGATVMPRTKTEESGAEMQRGAVDTSATTEGVPDAALFRRFRIIKILPLDKRGLRAAKDEFPNAEVTARNIPMDTDALRKRLGVGGSDTIHIFGLRVCGVPTLLVTEPCTPTP